MTPSRSAPVPRARRAAVVLPLLALAGCNRSDDIRTYTVPRPTIAAADKPADATPGTGVRLLGAIIPTGDVSRFVKFSGPEAKISPHEGAFDAFVKSLKIPADPKAPVEFTPPDGAKLGPAKMMRQTTFQFGTPGDTVDLYISDPFGGSLLDNVNRWRGEAGLKPVTEAELPTVTTELNLGGVKAYKVDFRGPGGKTGMMTPPFAGK